MPAGKIDVHFHLIPQFFRQAVAESGVMLATASYPLWSPPLALEIMDEHAIAVAIASSVWPGVGFLPGDKAAGFARRCNDYAADLIAQHPRRFGCFGTLPMHAIDAAIAEAQYCLETLRFEGIGLFASYGERFLGDSFFEPLMRYLDSTRAVVHVHPSLHPSSGSLSLKWPGWLVEYVFDTTRAAVNLIFSGARARFPEIRFILAHAGGTLPYLALRLAFAPLIEASLRTMSRDDILASLRSFYYDNALACGPQTMGALSRVTSTEHVLFGSDWPFCDDRVVAEEVGLLNAPDILTADAVEMIAHKNAVLLFPARS